MAGGERAGAVRQASEGLVASGELQEEVLVQLLPPGPLPSGQEDVAPDVLMHNAAAGGHATLMCSSNSMATCGAGGQRAGALPLAGSRPVPGPSPTFTPGPPAGCPS